MSSLYDAIGGLPALEVAVERLSQRLTADPELGRFFVGMDLHKIKTHLSAFLGHAVGGPVSYTGSTMRRAHEHLHIEPWHFDRFGKHLAETLHELAVPGRLVAAVMKRVWPLATQIVNCRAGSAAADMWARCTAPNRAIKRGVNSPVLRRAAVRLARTERRVTLRRLPRAIAC